MSRSGRLDCRRAAWPCGLAFDGVAGQRRGVRGEPEPVDGLAADLVGVQLGDLIVSGPEDRQRAGAIERAVHTQAEQHLSTAASRALVRPPAGVVVIRRSGLRLGGDHVAIDHGGRALPLPGPYKLECGLLGGEVDLAAPGDGQVHVGAAVVAHLASLANSIDIRAVSASVAACWATAKPGQHDPQPHHHPVADPLPFRLGRATTDALGWYGRAAPAPPPQGAKQARRRAGAARVVSALDRLMDAGDGPLR